MFEIETTEAGDVADAIAMLGDAFVADPLIMYLFRDNPGGVRAGAMEFFSLLLRVRLALDMPALVTRKDGKVRGAAMGYDVSRPAWPDDLAQEWNRFEARVPGFSARLAEYDKICEAHQPEEAHYYLGVIGIDPALQGQGAGKAMLDAFCAASRADPASSGVYLDTANPASLRFYYNNGFELRGESRLDDAPIWCVFKPT
jgi:ribosomal protein S18 acetylase RimI-like enzyme